MLTDQLVAAAQPALAQSAGAAVPTQGGPSTLTFPELRLQMAQRDAVADGYEIQTVIR